MNGPSVRPPLVDRRFIFRLSTVRFRLFTARPSARLQ
jgi:hypothetical protein